MIPTSDIVLTAAEILCEILQSKSGVKWLSGEGKVDGGEFAEIDEVCSVVDRRSFVIHLPENPLQTSLSKNLVANVNETQLEWPSLIVDRAHGQQPMPQSVCQVHPRKNC